jgi:(1->4)-alpha-D-glucan 1-alpha-D-glucosylmutase
MRPPEIPTATYRLQLHRGFSFSQAEEVVPYLAELGISHCYLSPILKARPASTHGYDIVDHASLNPEIGDAVSFDRLVETLRRHDMGAILDVVPNHMAVGGDDNVWWLDVLENGPSSPYSAFFDIDWQPEWEALRGKVLLPILGDHYGTILAAGELRLDLDEERGELSVRYFGHRMPIDPATYPSVLGHRIADLEAELGRDHPAVLELESLITAFRHLPPRADPRPRACAERLRDKEILKRRLAALCVETPEIAAFARRNVALLNGVVGEPRSFDRLHDLLEAQGYRLAYWQVAADEINYRRFFDINDLAGLRTENPEVFTATHRLILELVGEGKVAGLRIDHPDGLYDPRGYYQALCEALRHAFVQGNGGQPDDGNDTPVEPPIYLVVEKILAAYEHLPQDWPVNGTTGYDFAAVVAGLLVCPDAEHAIDRIYTRFTGHRLDFDDLLYGRKKLTINAQLSSELTVLTNLLYGLAQRDRHTRDFTRHGLRDAINEVVACFPVYRTYVTPSRISDEDRRYVTWAVAQAKNHTPAADVTPLDFLRGVLLREGLDTRDGAYRRHAVHFAMKLQQYTAPVMAKALEDTTLYIYNRLTSLNEVGSDPRRFGTSTAAFHHANQERARHWPHGLLTTTTHDSKRGEDVRARIAVLSEVVPEWRRHLAIWGRLNRSKKRLIDGDRAPSRNDEYLLYQTLIGAWPLGDLDDAGLAVFRERIAAYMRKAVREAKVQTSWINPDAAYEEAVDEFVAKLLGHPEHNAFLADFLPFQRRIARCGLLGGLAQLLLKLTSPGVPDLYQGSELWELHLVDPDNRQPVDYALRAEALRELRSLDDDGADLTHRIRELVEHLADGRAKLYLTWRVLTWRRHHRELFAAGEYLPLAVEGSQADHVCAFARRAGEQVAVVAVPRWLARLAGDPDRLPLGNEAWTDAWVAAPGDGEAGGYTNVLTGERVAPREGTAGFHFAAADLFRSFPGALLERRDS